MNFRAALRIAGLLGLFALIGPIHVVTKALLGRSRWPLRFLATAARICGARVRTEGEPLRPHTLLVANHTSWLDTSILARATDCVCVATQNLRQPRLPELVER